MAYDGPELSLPYDGPGALGQGKALKSILHAPSDIPIWLASVGPRNTELCAELCEGWLPMGLPPEGTDDPEVAASLDRGFARRTDGRGRTDFEIFNGLTVVITDDVQGWLDRQRPFRATYVGGMGSASHNYHVESMARRGFAKEAARIQELFLAGRRDEAIAAMPDEAMLQGALVGSPARHPRAVGGRRGRGAGRDRRDRGGRRRRGAGAGRRARGGSRCLTSRVPTIGRHPRRPRRPAEYRPVDGRRGAVGQAPLAGKARRPRPHRHPARPWFVPRARHARRRRRRAGRRASCSVPAASGDGR